MDPKELALAHFEKLVLVAFAGWLVMGAVGMVSGGGPVVSGEDVTSMRTAVEAHMKGGTLEEPTKPTWTEDLHERLAGAPESETFPSWIFHRRAQYLYQVQDNTPQYRPVHRPPVNLAGDAETRGQIQLTWSPSIENEYVLTSYTIQRREGDEGEWVKVAEKSPDDPTQFIDKEISSLAKYYYKVVSTARLDNDDPVVEKYKLKLSSGDKVKESDLLGPLGTKREIYVVPINVDPVTEQEEIDRSQTVGTADLKVLRWDSESSRWQEASFWRVEVGKPIGSAKKLRGRKEPFDFSTGAKLTEVRIEKRQSEHGYEEPWHFITIEWPDGNTEESNNKEAPKTD